MAFGVMRGGFGKTVNRIVLAPCGTPPPGPARFTVQTCLYPIAKVSNNPHPQMLVKPARRRATNPHFSVGQIL